MSRFIIIAAAIALMFILGGMAFGDFAVDISAGPNAQGQQEIAESEAYANQAEADANSAIAEENLSDQKELNDQTLDTRVLVLQVFEWLLKVGGMLVVLGIAVVVVVNWNAYIGKRTTRLALEPIHHSDGNGHTAFVVPGIPWKMVLVDDRAPGLTTVISAFDEPSLTYPKEIAELAVANALKTAAEHLGQNIDEQGLWMTIQNVLNGVRRLPGNQ